MKKASKVTIKHLNFSKVKFQVSSNVGCASEILPEMIEKDSPPKNSKSEIANIDSGTQASPSSTNGTERTVRFSVENDIDGRQQQSVETDEHTVTFNLKSWRSVFSD